MMSLGFQSISFSQNGWFWQNPLPNGNTLNSVKFVNAQTGIAVGDLGTILRSTNGGESWEQYNTNFLNQIFSLAYSDQNKVFAVGDDGLVIKSTNSGVAWERISIGTND